MVATVTEPRRDKVNLVGLEKGDYRGRPSTLCSGCGHNSISSQIITVAFELSLPPYKVIKMSGIGCSTKSPAYFLNRSHGFNALHGSDAVRGYGSRYCQPQSHPHRGIR